MTNLNSLQMFSNSSFNVRAIMRDGNPWFVAADVCRGLDLSNPSEACSKLDADDKITLSRTEFLTLISNEGELPKFQALTLVSEPGLYDLITQSRKQEAKAFKKWVTHEVIPSIRKNGYYSIVPKDSYLIEDPIERAKAWIIEQEQKKKIEQERDEAIRTKAFISSKREATAMVTARTEKVKRIAIEERIGEGMKWMSSAQLIKNYNIRDENGNLMKSGTLTKVLKKRNCKWRESDVPDASGYHYTIFWVADVVETLKLN